MPTRISRLTRAGSQPVRDGEIFRPAGTSAGTLLGYQDSNLDCQGQNLAGCQLPHTPLAFSVRLTSWARRDLNPHVLPDTGV